MRGEQRYLIDTNVISEIGKVAPNPCVMDWLEANTPQSKLSAITVKELYYGAYRMPEGRRRSTLLATTENLVWLYEEDVLPFDSASAIICAELHDRAVRAGRTPQIEDLMIAAICLNHGLCLATRNTKDFDYLDVPVVNPFEKEDRES
ncbi:MAG: type II toxin-antitoxin system VapC family toxin [Eggerthellaceae bacterium]|nr:type II toxin-antitoxin system VapC family toxin [Eggerthellaceae bacterium]